MGSEEGKNGFENDANGLKSKMWRADAPYVVVGSNISVEEMNWEEGHEELEWRKEVFKVAAEMLLEQLWHTLEAMEWSVARTTGPSTTAYRIEGGEIGGEPIQEDQARIVEDVWWSISPSPAKMEQRRRRRFGDVES